MYNTLLLRRGFEMGPFQIRGGVKAEACNLDQFMKAWMLLHARPNFLRAPMPVRTAELIGCAGGKAE